MHRFEVRPAGRELLSLDKPAGFTLASSLASLFTSLRWVSVSLCFALLVVLVRVDGNPFTDLSLMSFGLCVLGLVGLPHGGADAWVLWIGAKRSVRGFLKYLGSYLGIVGIAALLFYSIPVVAWFLFLATSVFHFGWEGLAHQSRTLSEFECTVLALLRGLTVVFVGSFSQPEFAKTVLCLAATANFATWFVASAELLTIRVIFPLFVFLVFFVCIKPSLERLVAIADVALLLFAFLVLPPFVAFVWYFCCVHSVYHWRELSAFGSSSVAGDWGKFSKYAAGLLFALPPICAWYWLGSEAFTKAFVLSPQGVANAFVGLGILTFPHMLLIHTFLRKEVGTQSVGY